MSASAAVEEAVGSGLDAGEAPAPTTDGFDAEGVEAAAPKYERGVLMWAKLAGFPWWPARVRSVKPDADGQPLVRVRFVGTNFGDERDYARLGPAHLFFFEEKLEWCEKMPYSGKSKALRKQWQHAVQVARNQPADDETEPLSEVEPDPVPPDQWLLEGHTWIGRRVARNFGKKRAFLGTVVKWCPGGEGNGEMTLFHVQHDDGDEEDLEEHEASEALDTYQQHPEAKRLAREADKARRKAERGLHKLNTVKPAMTALQIYKQHVETVLEAQVESTWEIPELKEMLQAEFESLGQAERQEFERRAQRDRRRYEREVQRRAKRNSQRASAHQGEAASGEAEQAEVAAVDATGADPSQREPAAMSIELPEHSGSSNECLAKQLEDNALTAAEAEGACATELQDGDAGGAATKAVSSLPESKKRKHRPPLQQQQPMPQASLSPHEG